MAHVEPGFIVICITLALFALLLLRALRVLPEFRRGIIYTMGQPTTVVGPGLVVVLPFIQTMEIENTAVDPCRIETWSGKTGNVILGKHTWPAITIENQSFKPGDSVRIVAVHGKTLTIAPRG